MMKILVLYYSHSPVCGIGSWVDMFVQCCSTKDWDVTIGLAQGARFNNPENITERYPDWKTLAMGARTGTEEGRIRAIERTIRKVAPDIIILNNLLSAFEAVRRLRLKRREMGFRLVVVNHGSDPGHAACILENKDVIDAVATVNRLSMSGLISSRDGMPVKRVFHIPNAVPTPLTQHTQKESKVITLGHAGRLTRDKGSHHLVPFWRLLLEKRPQSSLRLLVAGDGALEPDLKGSLQGQDIIFMGRQSKEWLYKEFYPILDIFLSFSPTEGWPLAIGEAMVHGVVPAVFNFHGLKEEGVLMDGKNAIVVDYPETEKLADRVSEAIKNKKQHTEMSENAHQTIFNAYSGEHFCQNWEEALLKATKLPELPSPKASRPQRTRFGLSESTVEFLRRVMWRRFPHATANEEWPPFSSRSPSVHEELCKIMGQS